MAVAIGDPGARFHPARPRGRGLGVPVRLVRYGAVSLVTVALTQVLLAGLVAAGAGPVRANVAAVVTAAGPGYMLNRRWVWGRRDAHRLWVAALPFVGLTLGGLVLSTVTVAAVAAAGMGGAVLNIANVGAFGVLWAVRFVACDHQLAGSAPVAVRGR